jgi:hypothetical protein
VVVTALSLSSVSAQVNQNANAARTGISNSGGAALKQVQWLGTRVSPRVTLKEQEYEQETNFDDEVWGQASQELNRIQKKQTESPFKERQVWQALANLERDSTYHTTLYSIYLLDCCFWWIGFMD